ncbi:tail fiber domain-containing protein [Roseovarius faecimaris]|nr:tail fiber domain-containing protein [Roseovarius faecimaris]
MTYSTKTAKAGLLGLAALGLAAGAAQAQSLVVDGSLCVGFDCPATPAFGSDTIRMQENNLRLHFEDTSTAAGFPRNDWRLYANDNANGGSSYFGVEDATAGRFVFRVFAGARSNALTIDSQGDLGLGTATPATDIDIKTGDTPAVRLQQDGTSGFSPQTWDVAGNEAGFFIRDVTSGSTLPFRILTGGAPSQSLVIDGNGDVGIGAGTSPDEALHVVRTNGTAKVLVEEDSGTTAARGLLELRNNGTTFMTLADESAGGETWNIQSNSGEFRFTNATGPGVELAMTISGDMTISGSLTQNSDKHAKMAIVPVDPDEILQKVADLPVSSWMYKDNADLGIRHMGPMAQDFHAAFGLGASDKGISSLDTSGVALAAIKALEAQNAALKAELAAVRTRLDRVESDTARD